MRAVIQRVTSAEVRIEDRLCGKIGKGLLVFLGIARGDAEKDFIQLASKIPDLRIFEDPSGKFNLSLMDIHGEMLVVSQFTLYADCRKGRRPSFTEAEDPARARTLYEGFIVKLREKGVPVQTGEFQAAMEVRLVNEGPVTLLLDSRQA